MSQHETIQLVFLTTNIIQNHEIDINIIKDAKHIVVLDNRTEGEEGDNTILEELAEDRGIQKTIQLVAMPSANAERSKTTSLSKVKKRVVPTDYRQYKDNCNLGCLDWYPKTQVYATLGDEGFRHKQLYDSKSFAGEGKSGHEVFGNIWILKQYEPEEAISSGSFPLPYAFAKRLVLIFTQNHDIVMDACGSLYSAAIEHNRVYRGLTEESKAKCNQVYHDRKYRIRRETARKAEKAEKQNQRKRPRDQETNPVNVQEVLNLPLFDPRNQYVLTPTTDNLTFGKASLLDTK